MKTVKIIHYPEGGNRTTAIFEAEELVIVEGYLHEIYANYDIPKLLRGDYPVRIFGSAMSFETPQKYWVTVLYIDIDTVILAGLNSEVYIMADGKTIASYKSISVE
jgi:hypothetical protein